MTYEEIEAAALALDPDDREVLYLRLLMANEDEPVEDDEEAVYEAEIIRRVEEIESGTADMIDGDEVRRNIQALAERLESNNRGKSTSDRVSPARVPGIRSRSHVLLSDSNKSDVSVH